LFTKEKVDIDFKFLYVYFVSTFLNHIEKLYGKGDKNRHADIFNALSLPRPMEGEWIEGLGCDMVFINPYGLVLKTMPKSGFKQHMQFGRNPFVLQPIKAAEFQNSCLLVLPGISHAPLYRSEMNSVRFISSRLSEFSIKSEDIREENIGFLPPSNGYSMPILLDHGCATGHEKSLISAKNNDDYTKYQKNAFRTLRHLMHNCWQGHSPKNSTALKTFLSYCHGHTSMGHQYPDKKIHSGWMDVSDDAREDYKPLKVKKAALKYNNRLCRGLIAA